MKIKPEQVGEILQRIYDSEIHFKMGWLWDGGVDYAIGSKTSDVWDDSAAEIIFTCEDKIVEALEEACLDIIKEYPDSTFTKWFNSKLK